LKLSASAFLGPDEVLDPPPLRALDSHRQHFGVDVRDRDVGAGGREAEGDVAGAARHIEDRFALAGADAADEGLLPQPVLAARHHVVHEVVARGDAGEDAAHPPRLFFGRHVLMAERDLVHRAAL